MLMSQIDTVSQLFVFWGIVVGIGIGCGIASVVSTLQRWFQNMKWFRFTILGVGFGLGILMIPLIDSFILNYGWRITYLVIGRVALSSLFPMIMILFIAQFLKRSQHVG
jgi:MFS family permease